MIKKLAKSIRGYWGATVATPLVMIGEVAMETTIPLVIAAIIDDGIKKLFTEETDIDIYGLRDQLKIVVNTFVDFAERYNEMSQWERYFTSWERVREELTETVRIPET